MKRKVWKGSKEQREGGGEGGGVGYWEHYHSLLL